MKTDKNIDRFNHRLDQVLGIAPGEKPPSEIVSSINDSALQMAEILAGLHLEADATPNLALPAKAAQKAKNTSRRNEMRTRFVLRISWVVALILTSVLLFAFRQPVLASVGSLFGYVYLSEIGFLPTNSTFLLKQPVLQEHESDSVTVVQGISTPQETTIVLSYNDIARPGDGAWLETENGDRLEISSWEYSPDRLGSRDVKLIFPPIPPGTQVSTLGLPEG